MSYKIEKHLLVGSPVAVQQMSTPNRGGKLVPKFVVHHFTASGEGDVGKYLCTPEAKASAHLVVPRAPERAIQQLAPFDVVTWHAGVSFWGSFKNLNEHSIGIEIHNPGALTPLPGGKFKSWTGTIFDGKEDGIILAPPPEGGPNVGWLPYTKHQIDVVTEITKLLIDTYKLADVLGHSDIAPGRKQDPGPAWPMEAIRAKLGLG